MWLAVTGAVIFMVGVVVGGTLVMIGIKEGSEL